MNAARITGIAEFVSHWAARTPDSEAIVSEGERLTDRVLNERVDACARTLNACGVTRGDRVAVLCKPRWESFVIFYALCRIGASWVGLNLSKQTRPPLLSTETATLHLR